MFIVSHVKGVDSITDAHATASHAFVIAVNEIVSLIDVKQLSLAWSGIALKDGWMFFYPLANLAVKFKFHIS